MEILYRLMRSSVENQSVEYMDNRISTWCAQSGKCAITGVELEFDDIHCHHIIPKGTPFFGTDAFSNLVIVHKNVHILIHATHPNTIQKYLDLLKLTEKQINKVNSFRQKAGLEAI